MKLIEIKNSLAKLYYEPIDFPLVISDFLTIDDGNQKILAQVVSIESTSKEDTNCAILKFSLDLDENNKQSTYSGYVPALDAIVSKTKPQIINDIFCSSKNYIKAGLLTNATKLELKLNSDILNKFLYIQSDRQEEITNLLNKLIDYNNSANNKTLFIKFNDLNDYSKYNTIVLGKDLKLPVNNDILNYIYENDLTGLTVEQKAIVQDILLEIQEYVKTLEDGYIPFNTLLDVVNTIYESDKSTGVVLLRNKLLKYNQLDIFASTIEEINALYTSLKNNIVTVLDVSNIDINWSKETTAFALLNIDEICHVVIENDDNIVDEKLLNELYKNENIKPVIASGYESLNAAKIKSFAQNIILFKPEQQQKAAASYNSFLMKLAPKEFIISGETTYYTPLIIKELPAAFVSSNGQTGQIIEKAEVIDEDTHQAELAELLSSNEEIMPLDSTDEETTLYEFAEEEETPGPEDSEIKNIFDESVEQEIAKDVDQMFTAESTEDIEIEKLPDVELDELSDNSDETYSIENQKEEAIISDDDLDILEQLSDTDDIQAPQKESIPKPLSQPQILQDDGMDELIADENPLEELTSLEDLEDSNSGILGNTQSISLEVPDSTQEEIFESLTENNSLPGVPIYQTEQPGIAKSSDGLNITEGNIVYHEKYGKGVVEELFNYGKRTLCSIQFDNVGRRLLDPNLAELKQM